MPTAIAPKSPETFAGIKLLSRKQVQDILGVRKTKFYEILANKKDPFPRVTLPGSKVPKFQLDKIQWWIEKHAQ